MRQHKVGNLIPNGWHAFDTSVLNLSNAKSSLLLSENGPKKSICDKSFHLIVAVSRVVLQRTDLLFLLLYVHRLHQLHTVNGTVAPSAA